MLILSNMMSPRRRKAEGLSRWTPDRLDLHCWSLVVWFSSALFMCLQWNALGFYDSKYLLYEFKLFQRNRKFFNNLISFKSKWDFEPSSCINFYSIWGQLVGILNLKKNYEHTSRKKCCYLHIFYAINDTRIKNFTGN